MTAIGYQCGLAYLVSFMTYQFGHVLFEGGTIGLETALSTLVLAFLVYQIVRKPKEQIIEVTTVVPSMKEG